MKDFELHLGRYGEAVAARLAGWEAAGFGRRLWAKDSTLWSAGPVPELADRLGWLDLPESARELGPDLARFTGERAAAGLTRAVVLGMGGSSLAPEVFARSFGAARGGLAVEVLDSTHPAAVASAAAAFDPAGTLFLVSSKSGTTTETLSLFRFFWDRVARLGLPGGAGSRFAAITDPGTPLERLARERGFIAVWNAPEEVGGRYSALTPFGLVPVALAGIDVAALAGRAGEMARACGPEVPAAESPGLRLGAALAELALAGRDKLTFVTSAAIAAFPGWLEQLIAESTGKAGKGIVPVVGETLAEPAGYGADRAFVALLLPEPEPAVADRLAALQAAGHPVIVVRLRDALDLGREIFRWELAVAAAGAALGINPFDQPDVQLAKELAQQAMRARAEGGSPVGAGTPAVPAGNDAALAEALSGWLSGARPGDYLGIQAFLPMTAPTVAALGEIQNALRDRTGLAVTLGFGPRFLHSTGQLHKGGPGTGRFLQIVDEPALGLGVPETAFTFDELVRAQADGDRQALEQRGRSVLRVELGTAAALAGLRRAVQAVAR